LIDALGLIATFPLALFGLSLVRAQLYNVTWHDPVVFLVATAALRHN